MGRPTKSGIQDKFVGPLKTALMSDARSRRGTLGEFEWLALCLTEPTLLAQVATDLMQTCDQGSRHFAANGRSVGLSEAAMMSREIHRDDLRKDDALCPTFEAPASNFKALRDAELPTTSEVSNRFSGAALPAAKRTQTKRPTRKAPVNDESHLRKNSATSIQSIPGSTGVSRGERRFDGINVGEMEHPMDQFRSHLYRANDT
jgi:hypothetical protein